MAEFPPQAYVSFAEDAAVIRLASAFFICSFSALPGPIVYYG